jgi:Polysaccharide lyase
MSKKLLLTTLVVVLSALLFALRGAFEGRASSQRGDFEAGLAAWTAQRGGGAQCANYGTPSKPPRLRGTFTLDQAIVGQGTSSGRFDLPADSAPGTYPLEACDLVTGSQPLGLGSDAYYGLMVYVPQGWTIANKAFWGVAIAGYHFQNIWGAPIEFELHPDHVTLSLETGGCYPYTTSTPGCQYRSNADNSSCTSNSSHTCLPALYVIPRGALAQGRWNEIIMHVHWAADSSGQIQTWYRVKGSSGWTQSSNVNGYPTVQWNNANGCCSANYVDEHMAYTAALTAPLTLWLDNILTGPSFNTIATQMP